MIRYIYTFFVGLFIAVFVGTGIAVFYEAPQYPEEPIGYDMPRAAEPTEEERQAAIAFQEKENAYIEKRQEYNQNVSIIILIVAVALLAIALLFAEKIGVIADSILLGGIFTLVYGIIRGMDSGDAKYRFVVASVGLLVALVLGYFKFTRHIEPERSSATSREK